MTELHNINVHLSEGQKRKLANAYRDNKEVSIRIAHNALSVNDILMVPMNTIKKLSKNKDKGKGTVVKISKANVRKQTGEGIFNSLMPVLTTTTTTFIYPQILQIQIQL